MGNLVERQLAWNGRKIAAPSDEEEHHGPGQGRQVRDEPFQGGENGDFRDYATGRQEVRLHSMAGKYSPQAQQELAKYEAFMNDVGRINSLCEQFAVAKAGQENLRASLKRASGQAKLKFMTQGMAQLSQICGAIELQAGRTAPQPIMTRALREHVGNLKFQLDLEMRLIIKEDMAMTQGKKDAKAKAAENAAGEAGA